jgi:hypothetical protein
MKNVHDMRARKLYEPHHQPSPLPIILGAVIAFGIGLLGVSGIVKPPFLAQAHQRTMALAIPVGASTGSPASDMTDRRIGRAEAAPLLKACLPMQRLTSDGKGQTEIRALYRSLHSASTMSRVAAKAGLPHTTMDDAEFAAIWGEIADCVYRQNGWVLCDADNRALAAEAANTYIRQLSGAQANDPVRRLRAGARYASLNRDYVLQNALSLKTRMMAGLRQQVAEGRLIAADFGMFAPAEVLQAVVETAVVSNACAGVR